MKPEIPIVANVEALYRAGAAEFVRQAGEAVQAKGSYTVALSGGSMPKGLYGLLASDPTLNGQVLWAAASLVHS
jgi:6-phosphogluconolactonase